MKRRNLILGLLAACLPAAWFRRATTPTLLNARGPMFNVKYPEFGAVGDGLTDDSAAIQLALGDVYRTETMVRVISTNPLRFVFVPR